MFALVLSFGLLLTALRSRKARSWRYGSGMAWELEWQSFLLALFFIASGVTSYEVSIFQVGYEGLSQITACHLWSLCGQEYLIYLQVVFRKEFQDAFLARTPGHREHTRIGQWSRFVSHNYDLRLSDMVHIWLDLYRFKFISPLFFHIRSKWSMCPFSTFLELSYLQRW